MGPPVAQFGDSTLTSRSTGTGGSTVGAGVATKAGALVRGAAGAAVAGWTGAVVTLAPGDAVAGGPLPPMARLALGALSCGPGVTEGRVSKGTLPPGGPKGLLGRAAPAGALGPGDATGSDCGGAAAPPQAAKTKVVAARSASHLRPTAGR